MLIVTALFAAAAGVAHTQPPPTPPLVLGGLSPIPPSPEGREDEQ